MDFKKAMDKKIPIDVKLINYNESNENYRVLEMTKNSSDTWRKYQKQGGVFARRVKEKTQLKTMENRIGYQSVKKGDWILMGALNEVWALEDDVFKKRFINESGDKTTGPDGQEYVWYKVNPGNEVAALQMHIPFKVKVPSSKEPLVGKEGDYIVKNYSDIKSTNPKDVWIVDEGAFNKTYKEII